MPPSRPIPSGVLALLLSGCLDFGFQPAADSDRDGSVPGDADTPSCPSKAEACTDRCGRLELSGCAPYECEACCTPVVTCESIQAQCGSLDTGCGVVACANHCDQDVSCVDNHCCMAEPAASTCRGLCGGTALNHCADQVSCASPCSQHSDGCRDAEPPQAATCFCPHAYQGETCAETQLPLVRPVDIAIDAASGRAYVLDEGLRAVLVVDLETGARWTLSDGDDDGVARGIGPAFGQPRRIVLDLPRNRAFVTDLDLDAVLQVDLEHGHRSYVSGQGHGVGPALKYPKGLALDVPGDVAYVTDAEALFEVRLSTGARRVVSTGAEGAAVGAGPALRVPMDLAVDVAGERAYVFCAEALYTVELASGDRTLLSAGSALAVPDGTPRGNGPRFKAAISGALDLANGRAFIGDSELNSVFAIDLASGDRSVLSTDADTEGTPHGAGQALEQPFGLRLDASGAGLWLVDTVQGALGRVELASGDRSWRVDGGVGPGPRLIEPKAVTLGAQPSQAFVIDTRVWSLVEVDLATGARSVFTGDGPALQRPVNLVVDAAGRYGYVADYLVGIVRVDLQSGLRHVVSDENDGSLGPALGGTPRIALDEPRQQLLVATSTKLMAVSLATGGRTILADSSHGSGPLFRHATDLAFDQASHTALLLDELSPALFRIDVVDGTRTVVSGQIPDGAVRGEGDAFVLALDVAFDASAQKAYVLDHTARSVVAVDLATGDRTPLSTVEGGRTRRGNGVGFVSPERLTLAGESRLLVVDSNLGAVLSVDIATGDRALVSRITF